LKIKYVGGGSGVEIDGVRVFLPNQPVEVPDHLIPELLETKMFVKVTEEKSFETGIKRKRKDD